MIQRRFLLVQNCSRLVVAAQRLYKDAIVTGDTIIGRKRFRREPTSCGQRNLNADGGRKWVMQPAVNVLENRWRLCCLKG